MTNQLNYAHSIYTPVEMPVENAWLNRSLVFQNSTHSQI